MYNIPTTREMCCRTIPQETVALKLVTADVAAVFVNMVLRFRSNICIIRRNLTRRSYK